MCLCDKGTSLLIHTATEQSSASYYGEQGLHYIDVKGESCLVPRGLSNFCSVSSVNFPRSLVSYKTVLFVCKQHTKQLPENKLVFHI